MLLCGICNGYHFYVTNCAAGKYSLDNKCVDCAAGTYSTAIGQTACTACPAGKFFVAFGARELAECGDCPLGTWSSTLGASSLTQCVKCLAGKRGKASGQATVESGCVDCTAGESYQDQTGQASCIPDVCPKGQYSSSA